MFTGIIKDTGRVSDYDEVNHVLTVSSLFFKLKPQKLGASIAIDGVCLTVSHLDNENSDIIGFDLGEETRKLTLLGKNLKTVNIEPSLCLGEPLDGHVVQGHVDGLAELLLIEEKDNVFILRFKADNSLAKFIAHKGSIAINGVSLTINSITDDYFSVCLVPYTWQHTGFRDAKVGDHFHIETDMMARYLHRFFECHKPFERSHECI